uniref:EPSILON-TOXIN n=1 Tax=Clostridium perfringens D TaxID=107819 RepID=UPI0002C3921C|nr:Chain A, EPSILON-TOXIN [Clostridium perfringens D]3ZJX_B Chain B, EPSILON-TOXIN [Clostridium perfringens D]3ZJX_C Chain C, EPSILON-TOXIN [Clostridium perfringens D]3ZJX_D Chain D, EPSILON-TOXIN [Clostridium perfringens D]
GAMASYDNVDTLIEKGRYNTKYNYLKRMEKYYPNAMAYFDKVTINPQGNDFYINNPKVELDGEPSMNYLEDVYVGKALLTNDTQQEQKLKSQSFTCKNTDTVTATTTHTVGTSIQATAKFTVPFNETGVSLTTSYSFANTNTNTNSKEITANVPSQDILVPANTTVEVIAYLKKVNVKGNVKLVGQVSGSEWGEIPSYLAFPRDGYKFSLSDTVNKSDLNEDGTININGKGNYSAVMGDELIVKVRNLNTNNVQEYVIPVDKIEGRKEKSNDSNIVKYRSLSIKAPGIK